MGEENNVSYFRNGLIVGAGFGVIGGALSALWMQRNRTLSADLVLENIKNAFLKEGPIEGSWIEFEKKPLRKFAVYSKIYNGGISRLEDGALVQYEFVADAQTGTVIDVTRL